MAAYPPKGCFERTPPSTFRRFGVYSTSASEASVFAGWGRVRIREDAMCTTKALFREASLTTRGLDSRCFRNHFVNYYQLRWKRRRASYKTTVLFTGSCQRRNRAATWCKAQMKLMPRITTPAYGPKSQSRAFDTEKDPDEELPHCGLRGDGTLAHATQDLQRVYSSPCTAPSANLLIWLFL